MLAIWVLAAVPLAEVAHVTWPLSPLETVSGAVVTELGEPVAGATVVLWGEPELCGDREAWVSAPEGELRLATATSGGDGRFAVRPPTSVRKLHLTASAEGLATSRVDDLFLPHSSYDLGPVVLHEPVELTGVVRAIDGRPLAGASIHGAPGPRPAVGAREPLAVTDETGRFACRTLPPGLVTLGASAPGRADLVLEPLELARGPNEVAFALGPEEALRVRVVASDGTPLPGARAEPVGDFHDRPWREPAERQAFWRGAPTADAAGELVVHGLPPEFDGLLRIVEPTHRPLLVPVREAPRDVVLEPALPVTLVVRPRADGTRPELYSVALRDGPPPRFLICGNYDDMRVARLFADSPQVARLDAHRWRVQWNGPGLVVDGGRPGEVFARAADGTTLRLELPEWTGAPIEVELDFEHTGRLAGRVVDPSGAPVSVRLGIPMSTEVERGGWLATTSDADGRFAFEPFPAGEGNLHVLDDEWTDDFESLAYVRPGEAREDVVVRVHRVERPRVMATGTVRVGGLPPLAPVLLAIDPVAQYHGGRLTPAGLAWSGAGGRFELSTWREGTYHVVPKLPPRDGGWRSFASEFPTHEGRWPYVLELRAPGPDAADEVTLHFPPGAYQSSTTQAFGPSNR